MIATWQQNAAVSGRKNEDFLDDGCALNGSF
jgi:hypothetical protein